MGLGKKQVLRLNYLTTDVYRMRNINNDELYIRVCNRFNRWLALEHNDAVSEIRRHDEVVLDNERSLLSMQNKPIQRCYQRDQPIIN